MFIKELLSEDRYSADYNAKIEERIQQLNAAQLQGMFKHLTETAKKSRSPMWRAANEDLLHRIEGLLAQRTAEDQAERKILEELRLKKKQKIRKIREEKLEKERVTKMIQEAAHNKAVTEVKEAEQHRLAAERVQIMQRVFNVEERRNLHWKIIAALYVMLAVVAGVMVGDPLLLITALGGLTIIAILAAYFAHRQTFIRPAVVTPEDLENQIHDREDILKNEAIMALKEKERKFEEQLRRDEEEAKKRKRINKERKRFEAQLMEQQRREQLAMAQEIFQRQAEEQSQKAASTLHASLSPSLRGPLPGWVGMQSMADEEKDRGEEDAGSGPEACSLAGESIEELPLVAPKSPANYPASLV